MTTKAFNHPVKSLLWMSDLHLDRLGYHERKQFFRHLVALRYDAAFITGDISSANRLELHLDKIAMAGGYRPVFFVLGNHDYFGSSFVDVESILTRVCARHRNLVALGHGEIITLSKSTALIGHRGWYDGRAGAGGNTAVECPDRTKIDDFSSLNREQFFEKLDTLGKDSARYIRQVLPIALSRYRNVMIGTHVPPFTQALSYNDSHCDWDRQPYFANRAAGNAIWGISQKHSTRNISVYAGHSHSPVTVQMAHNLTIHVAAATRVYTQMGQLLTIH